MPDGMVPIKARKPKDPMARAKKLAERMAKRLDSEDVGDISVALAILTSGIVHQYAEDLARAKELLVGIRRLEDRFIESAYSGQENVH